MRSLFIDKFSSSVFALIIAHLVFGIVVSEFRQLSWLHMIGTMGLIAFALVNLKEDSSLLFCFVAYIVSSEVLWRITGAVVLSELGKYTVAFVCLYLILRSYRFGTEKHSINPLAFMYLLLLLPAVLLAVNPNLSMRDARIPVIDDIFLYFQLDREEITFNLSGPFALSMAMAYFDKRKLNRQTALKLLIALLLPILSLLSLALFDLYSAEGLFFGQSSIEAASGGGGPNQVSSLFGLGSLLTAILASMIPKRNSLKLLLLFLGGLCLMQSALTFSRGGFWTALAGLITFGFFLATNPRFRIFIIGMGIIGTLIISFGVLPFLEDFTDGAISQRFSDFDTTHRIDFALGELRAFMEYPLTGVGAVDSYRYRVRDYNSSGASHTEFTRILAEHGIAGLIALVLLGIIMFNSWKRSDDTLERASKTGFFVWALAFMTHSAMRLAAPAFIIGIACADFQETE